MSTLTRGRRLAVEVSWDEAKDAILWVGAVPLHQHWAKLAPHFGDLLLAPQRRLEGGRVGWTWKLPEEQGQPVTSAQLALLRRRLAGELRAFEQAMGDGPRRDRKQREALLAAVAGLCRTWEYAPDAVLRQYVAQTDRGLRLHSWSAAHPAMPKDPDGPHVEPEPTHESGASAPEIKSRPGPAANAPTTQASMAKLIRRHARKTVVALLLLGLGGGGAILRHRGYWGAAAQRMLAAQRGFDRGVNAAPASTPSADLRPLAEAGAEAEGVGGHAGAAGVMASALTSRGGSAVSRGASPTAGADGARWAEPAKGNGPHPAARSDPKTRADAAPRAKPKRAIKWDFTIRLDASAFKLDWTISPAAVPATFTALRSSRGLSVDIPSAISGAHWELPPGLPPASAIAAPHHAQVASRPDSPLIPGIYELRDAADLPFIAIKIAGDGAVTAAVARGAHLYYWFSVRLAPTDRPPPPPATRFAWQRPWSAPLPASWRSLITPTDARVEVPVLPLTTPQQIESFSLHDNPSSWSLTAKVRERAAP